jgi:hypothetical protein
LLAGFGDWFGACGALVDFGDFPPVNVHNLAKLIGFDASIHFLYVHADIVPYCLQFLYQPSYFLLLLLQALICLYQQILLLLELAIVLLVYLLKDLPTLSLDVLPNFHVAIVS